MRTITVEVGPELACVLTPATEYLGETILSDLWAPVLFSVGTPPERTHTGGARDTLAPVEPKKIF